MPWWRCAGDSAGSQALCLVRFEISELRVDGGFRWDHLRLYMAASSRPGAITSDAERVPEIAASENMR